MDGGGSTKTQNVTTTSNSAPWAPVQPGLQTGIKDLTSIYNSGGFNIPRYPGQTLADTAPETTQGWQSITDTANDPSKGVGAAQTYNNAILNGDYSALQPMFDAARDTAASSYEAAGRYGSGYHDNAVSKGVGSVIANAAGSAVSAAPALAAAQYAPGQALEAVGTARQQTAQDQINAAIAAYNQDKTAPISSIEDYMAALSGNWGGSTTATQPVQSAATNPWLQIAGLGASAVGSAASSYFGG